MTTIRNQERLEKIIEAAGKWFDPETNTIHRRMKDPEKLIEYADKIARLYFIPNALDGRGEYQGRYEYRSFTDTYRDGSQKTTEYYYPIVKTTKNGKDGIPITGAATIQKDGEFWYYRLAGIYVHQFKPMSF